MSAKDFKFVSPGVFIEEIDNSQLPKSPIAIGPLVIGRSRKGPAYQPVRVDSFSEFVSIFGDPVAGEENSDLWRSGMPTAPTFAAYAAQAWLRNSSPLTFIRLLGDQSPDAAATNAAKAGWKSADVNPSTGGGAYGLFLFNSGALNPEVVDGTLAAIIYTTEGAPTLSGSLRGVESGDTLVPDLATTTSTCAMVYSSDGAFTLNIFDSSEVLSEETTFSLDRASENYIRKVLNTNATLTNASIVDASTTGLKKYWLGQTFEREVKDKITTTARYGVIMRLGRSSSDIANAADYKFATQPAQSGWFFSQDLRNTSANTSDTTQNIPLPMYDPASLSGVSRLFKLHSLTAGEELQRKYKVSIEDLQYSRNDNTPYGSFTLAIRDIKDSDNSKMYVERYTNLSLDPNSPNYISKQIGDRYYEWDTNHRRLIEYGSYANVSSIVRVQVTDAVDQAQADPEALPFGVEGPIKFGDFDVVSVDSSGDTQASLDLVVGANSITNLRTGDGGIISNGEDSAGGGIFAQSTSAAGLDGHTIVLTLTDIGFTDSSGAAISGTYTITFKNSADVSGEVVGAKEVIVSITNGATNNGATLAAQAARIRNVFRRDSSYIDGDWSAGSDFTKIFRFGTGWDLSTETAGGDNDSVIAAQVVNTSGVKLQARGYNGGAPIDGGNIGRYGGDRLFNDSDWKVNCSANYAHTSGDQTVTQGNATGASTVVLTRADGVTQDTFTANKTTGGFLVPHNVATLGDNLQSAIDALGAYTATDDNAGTLLIINTGDAGASSNNSTLTVNNFLDGAGQTTFTVQGTVATDGTAFNFDGGADDGDIRNAHITTDTCVTAGSGSSGNNRVFMASSGSTGTDGTGILVQYEGRAYDVPFTGSVKFPSLPLRLSASDGDLSDPTNAYFGAKYTRGAGDSVFEESTFDIAYPVAKANTFSKSSTAAGGLVTSWYFSLDDVVAKYKNNASDKDVVFYSSGSRSTGGSVTAISGSYKKILDMGYDRFTAAFYGGFDGFDITEKEPFNDSRALVAGATDTTSAMFYSVKKAIDFFADPEFIESNILSLPGIVNEGLTTHMIETCESRGDALALIDPRGGYIPSSENALNEQGRITSGLGRGGVSKHVTEVADALEDRNLNSSYGATYYPWVRISDTISGRNLWAPPSVAAIGAMSYSENNAALWFAPAGFNRGGLTDGAAGIPVTNVRSRLTSAERDYLYERNINPIATFPNEGIVIFGQKTLQVTPSALDRINVRRLMIFVKKEISRIASGLLFDQNVEQTWSRFTGQVNPFLTNIKNNFGLDAFKVILDETTTTPDLIDRNTIYAKIFLKPTKAVEFFAIDFVITNSGAGFED